MGRKARNEFGFEECSPCFPCEACVVINSMVSCYPKGIRDPKLVRYDTLEDYLTELEAKK